MLILASNSKRRIKLLNDMGLTFKTVVNNVDETFEKNLKPFEIVETLSKRKALEALKNNPKDTIIAADTIVCYEGDVLGQPKDNDEAFSMLKRLSGNKHLVYTGVTIVNEYKEMTFHSKSEVYMKELNDIQIYEYIKTGEPLDKAGAYAIQGEGGNLIEKYIGDFFTIVGLPLKELQKYLKEFDYE